MFERDLNPSAEGAGIACERVRWTKQRAGDGAAVEKVEEKRKPDDFFGHRKRGCKATSSPSFSARKKHTFVYQDNVSFFQRNKSLAGFVKCTACVKYAPRVKCAAAR